MESRGGKETSGCEKGVIDRSSSSEEKPLKQMRKKKQKKKQKD